MIFLGWIISIELLIIILLLSMIVVNNTKRNRLMDLVSLSGYVKDIKNYPTYEEFLKAKEEENK